MPTVHAAAIGALRASTPARIVPPRMAMIGSGLDQSGAAEHFVLVADAAAGSRI